MKTMKMQNLTRTVGLFFLTLTLLAAPVFHAAAASLTWTNAAGNLLWSTASNWDLNVAPGVLDDVTFDLPGTTNNVNLVNSIVAVDTQVTNVFFNPTNPFYHTILINPGKTLSVMATNNTTSSDKFTVRLSGTATGDVANVTIRGQGRVVVGDTNNPLTTDSMRVHKIAPNPNASDTGMHWATLDLSQLDYWAIALGSIKVGGVGGNSGGAHGTLKMAKTNLVIIANTSDAATSGFLIGNGTGTSAGFLDSAADVQLGQETVLRLNNMKVGGSRSSLGTMEFQSGLLPNPTLKLRGVDGLDTTPAGIVSIGDNFNAPNATSPNYTTGTSTGRVDLVGGTVDALVTSIFVGRNMALAGATSTRTIGGNGTLTWAAGTIAVTTLNIGSQAVNNGGSALGVVNILTNASLAAVNVSIGRDMGAGAGTASGTLNIAYGAQATVTNSILEDSATTTGTSTINVTNGTLKVGGQVRVDNLTAINSTLTLVVTPTNTTANPVCNVTNLTLGSTVTINVSGSGLTLSSYPLIKYMGSIGGGGFTAATLGAQPLSTIGYLFNNTANKTIDLVVTNVPAVRWGGNLSGDWDINTTANWTNTITSLGTTFNGEPTVFNDSATGTKTVNLTTALSPTTVVVNNTTPYTFVGSGGISGTTDLFKNGSGTLEIANGGVNNYSGPTLVAGGTLRVNSTLSGSIAVTVQAGATLGGTGVISAPVTIESAGMLAAGNSIGTLSIVNNLMLSAGSSNIFEVNSDTLACDQVAVSGGSITYGGTLVLSLSGSGTGLTNGAVIPIFTTVSASGAFAQIVPKYPAGGMIWDTNFLTSDGTLRIISVPTGNLVTWTNVIGGNQLWSNPANWIRSNPLYPGASASNTVPTVDDTILFGNVLGFTNGFGMVNNIVDSSQTISNYNYEATTNNGYHNTLIQPGVTLTLQNASVVNNERNFHVQGAVGLNNRLYDTIQGAGASFVVGIPSVVNVNYGFEITATCTNTDASLSSHRAILDMSNLDNFAFWGGFILLADGGSGTDNQGCASLLLARTNMIVVGRSTSISPASPQGTFRIGHNTTGNGTGQSECLVELGQENTICAEFLRLGAAQSLNGSAIRFRTGLINPTLKLRQIDQVSRMLLLTLGDNRDTVTTIPSTGILNLNGGSVDAMVATMYVGRSCTTAGTTQDGGGNGLLTFNAGTFDVTTLNIGCQSANNLASCTGVVQVANSGLLVADNINIGNDTGTRTGRGYGTLNLGGGTVSVTGNIAENNTGGDGSSTINLTNGYISVAGTITVDTVNAISGVISNVGLMTAGTVKGAGTIAGPLTVLTGLAPGNSIGTLTNFGDLILSSGSTNLFEVNTDTLAHDFVTGMNSVTYGGTLVISPSGAGAAITNNASVKLFSAATYSGSFAAIVPTIPAVGFAWDTSQLTVNGTLKIVATVNTTPTNLTFAVIAGNKLDIAWPSDHTGWRLQAQTNTINVGISNNWFTVAGSTTTNHVIMPVNPVNGAVFYRLIYP